MHGIAIVRQQHERRRGVRAVVGVDGERVEQREHVVVAPRELDENHVGVVLGDIFADCRDAAATDDRERGLAGENCLEAGTGHRRRSRDENARHGNSSASCTNPPATCVGMAIPSPPAIMQLMPTTAPSSVASGPPELPGASRMSARSHASSPLGTR